MAALPHYMSKYLCVQPYLQKLYTFIHTYTNTPYPHPIASWTSHTNDACDLQHLVCLFARLHVCAHSWNRAFTRIHVKQSLYAYSCETEPIRVFICIQLLRLDKMLRDTRAHALVKYASDMHTNTPTYMTCAGLRIHESVPVSKQRQTRLCLRSRISRRHEFPPSDTTTLLCGSFCQHFKVTHGTFKCIQLKHTNGRMASLTLYLPESRAGSVWSHPKKKVRGDNVRENLQK